MTDQPSPSRFELLTCRYQAFQPAMGVAVQSSNGRPRWALKYDLSYAAPETYPPRRIMKLPKIGFTEEYHRHLAGIGVDGLASRFRAIATAAGDHRIVLLCFEDLTKPGDWCHRTLFAEWWKEKTGDDVRELAPADPGASRPGPPPDATLFD